MSENDLVSLVPDASAIRSVKLVVNNDGEGTFEVLRIIRMKKCVSRMICKPTKSEVSCLLITS